MEEDLRELEQEAPPPSRKRGRTPPAPPVGASKRRGGGAPSQQTAGMTYVVSGGWGWVVGRAAGRRKRVPPTALL